MVDTGLQRLYRRTLRYLEALTRSYYSRRQVTLPADFPLREFAAQLWGSKSYIRHLSFQSESRVKEFLVQRAPRHFYYSSARYDQPGLDDMDAKGWRSSDIVFDIDADHFDVCSQRIVKAESPFEGETTLVDDSCIPEAALATSTLVDVLVEELGFEPRSIRVEFSGHRGFHVTVYLNDSDERARSGQDYRRELVNYVKCIGLDVSLVGGGRKRKALPVPPLVSMAGFRGRVARVAARLAMTRGLESVARVFYEQNPVRAASLYAEYRSEVDSVIEEATKLSCVDVDEQVTVDLKRLIRASYSVNGKTGLVVVPVALDGLQDFALDSVESIGDDEPIRVRMLAEIPSSITILGNRVRLKPGDQPRLPSRLAVYLMAKGLAVLAGGSLG